MVNSILITKYYIMPKSGFSPLGRFCSYASQKYMEKTFDRTNKHILNQFDCSQSMIQEHNKPLSSIIQTVQENDSWFNPTGSSEMEAYQKYIIKFTSGLNEKSKQTFDLPFYSQYKQEDMQNTFESFEVTFLGSLRIDIESSYLEFLNGFGFITSLTEALVFILLFLIVVMNIIIRRPLLKIFNFENLLIKLYLFILNLVKEIIVNKTVTHVLLPVILSIGYTILTLNLLGLVPFAFSATGHLILTMTLAFVTFLGGIVLALKILKLAYFAIFIPRNCPPALLPVVSLIETMSYIIRPFSLGIRLFANMLSGHILLSIIYKNFVRSLISKSVILVSLAAATVSAFFSLETLIAFIQTYVFCILTTLFFAENLEDRSWSHH